MSTAMSGVGTKATYNLSVLVTKPLRKVILAIIESKRISAKKKAADAAAEAVAAGKGF